jgi:hypothetical protein
MLFWSLNTLVVQPLLDALVALLLVYSHLISLLHGSFQNAIDFRRLACFFGFEYVPLISSFFPWYFIPIASLTAPTPLTYKTGEIDSTNQKHKDNKAMLDEAIHEGTTLLYT